MIADSSAAYSIRWFWNRRGRYDCDLQAHEMPHPAMNPGPSKSRTRLVMAGISYALIVFLAGFCFGAVRVLMVVPRLGETMAVLIEVPLMLLVSWMVARWCTARYSVDNRLFDRALMGSVSFVALMILELGVGVVVFGRSLQQWVLAFGKTPGIIGLAAQVCCAILPIVQIRRS